MSKAKLVSCEIAYPLYGLTQFEIRLEWDNGRRQGSRIEGPPTVERIEEALHRLLHILHAEKELGKI